MQPKHLRSEITPTLCFVFLITHFITPLYAAEPPALMLANSYCQGNDVSAYWVSEKLDGVRAYWNGSELISRGGNRYQAPSWFTADFPATPLDGELWMGRGRFGTLSGAVRRYVPNEEEWREIRFMVFDLPSATGSFDDRLKALKGVVSTTASAYMVLVEQQRVASESELMQQLDAVVTAGGEGLMLHHANARYRAFRSDDLLKLKRFQDAEAIVIEHLPGKGKYLGQVGSLLVEDEGGRRFRLGSGLSDQERRTPPPIGAIVTYKYYGLTQSGLPRFASFLRLRNTQ